MKTIVLLSGGLDSATCLAMAAAKGSEVYALSFDYAQKHKVELESARKLAKFYKVREHLITEVRFTQAYFHNSTMNAIGGGDAPTHGAFGGSALTDDVPVPKDGLKPGVAPTYVPGRNMIFLSFALGWADSIQADQVVIGVNALDYSGYPDCRPTFIDAMREVARQGTKRGTEGRPTDVVAPLVNMTKKEIILEGQKHGVPWDLTHSCYDPQIIVMSRYLGAALVTAQSCGKCDSCRIRLKGFEEAGLKDPVAYVSQT